MPRLRKKPYNYCDFSTNVRHLCLINIEMFLHNLFHDNRIRHRPVLNADVWKPDQRRWQHQLFNVVVAGRIPRQIVIIPLLIDTSSTAWECRFMNFEYFWKFLNFWSILKQPKSLFYFPFKMQNIFNQCINSTASTPLTARDELFLVVFLSSIELFHVLKLLKTTRSS